VRAVGNARVDEDAEVERKCAKIRCCPRVVGLGGESGARWFEVW